MENVKIKYGDLIVSLIIGFHVAFYTIWTVYRAGKGEPPITGFWIIVFPVYLSLTVALFQMSFSAPVDVGLIWVVVVSVAASIVFFAAAFVDFGIIAPDGRVTRRFGDCLYFSVVTFTTLGYGDFTPTPAARPVAAAEAIIGYFFLGLLVTIIARNWSLHETPE